MSGQDDREGRSYWLDDPRNVDRIVHGLYALCALLLAIDLFPYKHPHYGFEDWFGYYCVYGFLCCVGLVLIAKGLRVFLKRDEDYYD